MSNHNPFRPRSARWVRPAPPGITDPSRTDRPPDGWANVKPSPLDRTAGAADVALLTASSIAVESVSRRRALRLLGQAGLIVGLATTGLFRGERVLAHGLGCNALDPNNQLPGACGPSPLCYSLHCSSGQCHTAHIPTRRRAYGGSTCTCGTCPNCWTEHCCAQNGSHWTCCDCCQSHPAVGGTCSRSSCSNTSLTMRKCICRRSTGGC